MNGHAKCKHHAFHNLNWMHSSLVTLWVKSKSLFKVINEQEVK